MTPEMLKSRFEGCLLDIKYCDWEVMVKLDGERCYLQVGFWEYDNADPDHRTGEKMFQTGRKWVLSPHMTKSEVVQTAFKAILTAEEHEAREKFTYKGRAIFGPHFNVDILADMCGKEMMDVRVLKTA